MIISGEDLQSNTQAWRVPLHDQRLGGSVKVSLEASRDSMSQARITKGERRETDGMPGGKRRSRVEIGSR